MEKGGLAVACPWTLGKEVAPIILLQPITRSTTLIINSHLQVLEHVPIASRFGLAQLVP